MNNQETNQPQKTQPRFFYGYVVVLAVFCIMTVMYGTRISFGVFFKPMIFEFGWTRALMSGAFSLSTVVQGLLSIVMGNLNDRIGPRVVLTICGLLAGIGYLLMSQINTAGQLYLVYVVIIGIGMGGVFVPLLSSVARWFVRRRSLMTGIAIAGLGAGTFIIPPIVNWLVFTYDWRTSYIIVGSLILVIVILAAQFLRRDPIQKGQVPYGKSNEEGQELNSGIGGFSLKEAAYTSQFWILFAMFFSLGFCILTIAVHIVPHATDLGISAASAAKILATTGVAHILGGVVMGSAADKIGNRQVLAICFFLMVAALFLLVPLKVVWAVYLLAAVLGFGGGGGSTVESPLVAELFGMSSHGLIFGVMSFGFTIGAAFGPFIAGYIFDITSSYQLAFLLSAVVGIAGIILAAALRPVRRLDVKI